VAIDLTGAPELTAADVMGRIHPSVLGVVNDASWPGSRLAGTVSVHASVGEVARLMLSTGSSLLIVVYDDGGLAGMILRSWLGRARSRRRREQQEHRSGRAGAFPAAVPS
jgi:hypothetical protein